MINFKKFIFCLSMVFISTPLNLAHSMDKEGDEPNNQLTKKIRIDVPNEFVREAFLSDDIEKLKDANKEVFSRILNKDAKLYTCEETVFEKLFPVCSVGEANYETDKSFFAGQIRNSMSNNGIGSGTLVDIKKTEEGKIRITGITALHNFVDFSKSKGLEISTKFSKNFFLGSKVHPTEQESVFALGNAEIDKIMVQKVPSKDICLFEGEFTFTKELFEDNNDFFEKMHKNIPSIVENKIEEEEEYESFVCHYPLGKKDQRKNEGKAFGTGKHKIESLFGSSGAALFNKNSEIFGIHTGVSYKDLRKDVIAEYDQDKDIPVSDFNLFEIISQQDYNDLKDGIDLFGSKGDFNKEIYNAISKLVESISK